MRRISPQQLVREVSSLLKNVLESGYCIVPADSFLGDDAIQHDLRICRKALANSIIELYTIINFEPISDAVVEALRSLAFIVNTYFTNDIIIGSGYGLSFRIADRASMQVKMSGEKLYIVLPVRVFVRRVVYAARCGALFHGAGYPVLVPIARQRINEGKYLHASVVVPFYGMAQSRSSRRSIRIDLSAITDNVLGEIIRQLYTNNRAVVEVDGSVLVLERAEPCRYCTPDGSICLELVELAGNRGDLILAPRIVTVDENGRRTVKHFKYIIVKGMDRVEVKEKYIILR